MNILLQLLYFDKTPEQRLHLICFPPGSCNVGQEAANRATYFQIFIENQTNSLCVWPALYSKAELKSRRQKLQT